jgi:hypothetical protein
LMKAGFKGSVLKYEEIFRHYSITHGAGGFLPSISDLCDCGEAELEGTDLLCLGSNWGE